MSQENESGNVKVELYLSSYGKKADLNNAAGVDTYQLQKNLI